MNVWPAALAATADLAVFLTGAPAQETPVPLPSDEGFSLAEAWEAAWTFSAPMGPRGFNGLVGYEGLAGADQDGRFGGRSDYRSVIEALDGRPQEAGFWAFLVVNATSARGVLIDVDGSPRWTDASLFEVRQTRNLAGLPTIDSPAAVRDCRLQGADDYLHETVENYIGYTARPIRDVHGEPNWMLFVIFSTAIQKSGEIESAACRVDQASGTVVYVPEHEG